MDIILRIVAWNINRLTQRAHVLEAFLWNDKIDVVLISEAYMTRTNYSKIRGYKVYHSTRLPGKGGSALIIKENIKHYEDAKYETTEIQATTVTFQMKSKEIAIAAVYCLAGKSQKEEHYRHFFQTLGDRFIIGSDFNTKHTLLVDVLPTDRNSAKPS